MALQDALDFLKPQPGENPYGYISRGDLELVLTQVYSDRLPGGQGIPGIQGLTGLQGGPGWPGDKGSSGEPGERGPIGLTGPESITTVDVLQGGAFGSAAEAQLDEITKKLTLTLPSGPPGPPAITQAITRVIDSTTVKPGNPLSADLFLVASAPAWAPPCEPGDLLAITSGSTWVNVGKLGTARLSTAAGNVLTMEPANAAILHRDADHITLLTRTEAIDTTKLLRAEIEARLSLAGGELTGPLRAPTTLESDAGNTVVTKDFAEATFAPKVQSTITAQWGRFDGLSVVNIVHDLQVGTATSPAGALSLVQADSLYAPVVHQHAEYATKGEVLQADQPTTATNTLTLSGAGNIASAGVSMGSGLRIAPLKNGAQDPERAFYYDGANGRFVFLSPPSGESILEVKRPIIQTIAPTDPNHTANKQYVDDRVAQTYATLPLTILDNSALTGSPTAPTAPVGDDSALIATTAFVQREAIAKLKTVVAASTSWDDFKTRMAAL